MEIGNVTNSRQINNNLSKKETSFKAEAETNSEQLSEAGAGLAYPGASQINKIVHLSAGNDYAGKGYNVPCIGTNPITLEEVTPDNVDELSKHIDIWYQGGAEKAEEAVASGNPDPRFLHPKVGESFQHYGLEPINGDYVTHDPEILEYARENGLTEYNDSGEECFLNGYNGDKSIIESTYTNEDGDFLSESGGLNGKMTATQVKDTKTILLPVGSKVTPLESDNPKTIKVGDVVMCAVKKGKAKNDWFVKPVTEFLKTAKKTDENRELINSLENFVANGSDPKEWAEILKEYS